MSDLLAQKKFSNANGRFGLLLSILFFVLPFGQHFPINLVLMVIVLHSLAFLKLPDWRAAITSPLFLLPFALVAFHAVSILWAGDSSEGLVKLNLKLGLVFIPLVIAANRRFINSHLTTRLLWVFVSGNIGAAVFVFGWATWRVIRDGAWYWTTEGSDYRRYYFLYENLSEPLMHPGYLSTYIGFAMLVSIYLIWKNKAQKRMLGFATLLFLFFTLIMLQGRINILAFFAVLGVGAFVLTIQQRAYKWLLLPLVPVLLLSLFLLLASEKTRERYFELPDMSYDISGDEFNSATYRLAEWLCASDVIKEHPIIGTGLGDNHEALMQAYRDREFLNGLEHRFNAHNQYLETTIATGFIGLILLLLYLWGYGQMAYKQGDFLLLSCLLFFAISMLTESMLERVWAVNLLAIFFSIQLLGGSKTIETQADSVS